MIAYIVPCPWDVGSCCNIFDYRLARLLTPSGSYHQIATWNLKACSAACRSAKATVVTDCAEGLGRTMGTRKEWHLGTRRHNELSDRLHVKAHKSRGETSDDQSESGAQKHGCRGQCGSQESVPKRTRWRGETSSWNTPKHIDWGGGSTGKCDGTCMISDGWWRNQSENGWPWRPQWRTGDTPRAQCPQSLRLSESQSTQLEGEEKVGGMTHTGNVELTADASVSQAGAKSCVRTTWSVSKLTWTRRWPRQAGQVLVGMQNGHTSRCLLDVCTHSGGPRIEKNVHVKWLGLSWDNHVFLVLHNIVQF